MPPNWYRKKNTIMMIQNLSFEQMAHCSRIGREAFGAASWPMLSSVTRSRVKKYSISAPAKVTTISAMTKIFQWL